MRKWECSQDIMADIQTAFEDLASGKATVEESRAKANLLKAATKQVETILEHAKATGRLAQGDDTLPGFTFGPRKEEKGKK